MPFSRYIGISEAVELCKTHRTEDMPRAIALARSFNYSMETWWSYQGENRFGSEFFIFGTIAEGSENFIQAMQHCQGRVTVRISCPGGDAAAALKVGRWIATRGNCTGIVSGRCDSAANLILAGCERRVAAPSAKFMIHSIKMAVCGTAPQLRAQANDLDGCVAEAAEFFASRIGQPLNHVEALLRGSEFYFNTVEAVAFGLIHDVMSEVPRASDARNFPSGNADTPAAPNDDALAYELARALATLRVRDPNTVREALPNWLLSDRPARSCQPDAVGIRRPAGILTLSQP